MSDATVADGLPETEPATGLDAIISGALDEAKYGEEPVAAAPVDDTAPVKTEAEIKLDADGRARDATGKFASTKPAEPEATAQAVPAEGEAKPDPLKAAEPALQVQPIEAPARWSEAEKAEFAKLPREAQTVLSERYKAMEADYTRKSQETAETRKSIEPVLAEFERADPLLRHMGLTKQQFLAESVNVASNLLSSDPGQRANAIAYLVQHRQVPLPELLNALGIPTPQADGSGPDPVTLQLHQKVQGLEQQLRSIGQQRQLDETQRAQSEFDAIGQTKDDSGQLKYPYFGRVSKAMIQLVATNQADTWDAAYSKAVRLDDDLYRQSVETERTRVLADTEKARQAAVDKAKKAAPVKESSGSSKGSSQVKGLDAILNSAMEAHGLSN